MRIGGSCQLSVVSCQSSVVSRVFSGDPKGSAFHLRISDFGFRIAEWGIVGESRITQKLIGRTKPFGRKLKAVRG